MLDTKDKKILAEYCLNARLPATIIAKRVGLSREVVEYRVQRLLKLGIIKKFITLIDIEALGYKPYNVILLMENFNEKNEREVTNYLMKHPAVRWVVSCFGKWDILFRINAKDRTQFDNLLSDICEHFSDNLVSCEVLTSIKKLKLVNPAELFGYVRKIGDIERKQVKGNNNLNLTNDDVIILRELSNNSRIGLIDLSKRLRLTPEAVKYRIKKLETQGVIKGYSCLISLSALNLSWYILFFSLRDIGKKDEKRLSTIFHSNNKVWFADKNIGRWNLRLELLAKDTNDFHKTLVELRNHLTAKMDSFELLLIFNEYVNERFPSFIFNELMSEPKKRET